MAPATTPRPLIDRLNAEIVRILGLPDIREKFLALGADPLPSTPRQFSDVMRRDADRAGKLIKAAGVKAD